MVFHPVPGLSVLLSCLVPLYRFGACAVLHGVIFQGTLSHIPASNLESGALTALVL